MTIYPIVNGMFFIPEQTWRRDFVLLVYRDRERDRRMDYIALAKLLLRIVANAL